jgi:hypothetical protein
VSLSPDLLEDQPLLTDTLDGQTDILDQLREIVRHAIDDETSVDAIAVRQAELAARKQRLITRADACRSMVQSALETLGLRRLEAPDFTGTLGNGPCGVRILDETALEAAYVRVTRTPARKEIAAALKAGKTVKGAELSNAPTIFTIRRG